MSDTIPTTGWKTATIAVLTAMVAGSAIAVTVPVGAGDSPAGTYSLGVTVNDGDGTGLDGIPVTIKDSKTHKQVFSGFTDNAGQIAVTLPRGKYDIVAQNQQKTVDLKKNNTQTTFTLATDELPKAVESSTLP